MPLVIRERSWWGWGYADAALPAAELAGTVRATLGFGADQAEDPVPLDAIELPAPRLRVPDALREISSTTAFDRVSRSSGQAYRDVVRVFRGRVDHPTDVVVRPRTEQDVLAVLDWATGANAAVIPHGGGTSVVGGVEPRVPDHFDGVITLDLRDLAAVLEIDHGSQAAHVQAGTPGPALERQLAEHGLTARFYPQSFEFSTVGGWIATRAGGHFATVETRVDDLVESVRAISYAGLWESRRLPASGAGPSPDRWLLGSEGTLGVITSAWLRVRPRPACRASQSVWFPSWSAGVDAVRDVARSGLAPSNLRLVDAGEAARTAGGDGSRCVLLLAFESADEPVDARLSSALRRAGSHGGTWEPTGTDASASWRAAFLGMPYLRDALVRLGVLVETFETAVPWSGFDDLHRSVTLAVRDALGGPCHVSCRITHAYPDGAAPYFTVLAPVRRGAELETWDRVKRVAVDAVLAAGGTVTHHHAVGRDHAEGYRRQRPEPFARALGAAKTALDPDHRLNPGCLL